MPRTVSLVSSTFLYLFTGYDQCHSPCALHFKLALAAIKARDQLRGPESFF